MSSAKTTCVLNQCGGPAAKHHTTAGSLHLEWDGGEHRKSKTKKTHQFK